jgi:hypothetical protein
MVRGARHTFVPAVCTVRVDRVDAGVVAAVGGAISAVECIEEVVEGCAWEFN